MGWPTTRSASTPGTSATVHRPTPDSPCRCTRSDSPRLVLPSIDGADVTELADTCRELGRWTFLLVVAAITIIGVTGVPVNPLAIF